MKELWVSHGDHHFDFLPASLDEHKVPANCLSSDYVLGAKIITEDRTLQSAFLRESPHLAQAGVWMFVSFKTQLEISMSLWWRVSGASSSSHSGLCLQLMKNENTDHGGWVGRKFIERSRKSSQQLEKAFELEKGVERQGCLDFLSHGTAEKLNTEVF